MIAFHHASDQAGTITWIPSPKIQDLLAATPPEAFAGIEAGMSHLFGKLAGTLVGSFLGRDEKVFEDLDLALTEVAQRALVRNHL